MASGKRTSAGVAGARRIAGSRKDGKHARSVQASKWVHVDGEEHHTQKFGIGTAKILYAFFAVLSVSFILLATLHVAHMRHEQRLQQLAAGGGPLLDQAQAQGEGGGRERALRGTVGDAEVADSQQSAAAAATKEKEGRGGGADKSAQAASSTSLHVSPDGGMADSWPQQLPGASGGEGADPRQPGLVPDQISVDTNGYGQGHQHFSHKGHSAPQQAFRYSKGAIVAAAAKASAAARTKVVQGRTTVIRYPHVEGAKWGSATQGEDTSEHEEKAKAGKQPDTAKRIMNLPGHPTPGAIGGDHHLLGAAELAAECSWAFHNNRFLGELAGKDQTLMPKSEAQAACVNLAAECVGVTCANKLDGCSPRMGMPYLDPSPTGEVSFVKEKCSTMVNQAAHPFVTLGPTSTGAEPSHKMLEPQAGSAVIVVIAHNRPEDLKRCLRALLSQDGIDWFSLALSIDDPKSFMQMESVGVSIASSWKRSLDVWRKMPDLPASAAATLKIGAHFKFALTQAFDVKGFTYGIFVEGDLEVSPDFLYYFRSAGPLLDMDPSLFCISAWHDNGFKSLARDEKRLFRTDYFPGLGWMIRKETWGLLRSIWPRAPTTGWDHWVRHGAGLDGRECIAPEVPRTKHFGEAGTNVKRGNNIARQLSKMVSSNLKPGKLGDLSFLLKEPYDQQLHSIVSKAEIRHLGELEHLQGDQTYVVPYAREDYKKMALSLLLTASQPRAKHTGIIMTRHPRSGAGLILVDRRRGDGWLPPKEVWHANPDREVAVAKPGQSCADYCIDQAMRCVDKELEYINECSFLLKHFTCERGCGHQVGPEIPCYVHQTNKDTALQCLVTDEALPSCKAAHSSTTRLCVCVPAPSVPA